MNRILDKIIILIFCMVSYVQYRFDIYIVVPVLCAVAAGALQTYLDRDLPRLLVFLAYCAAACVSPVFCFFLPLVSYDVFSLKWRYAAAAAVVPGGIAFTYLPLVPCLFIALYFALAYFMNLRTVTFEKVKSEYTALRDEAKEFSLKLQEKNRELMEKQDYEVNLATLNERNRIARDIHDNVGHVLTNSILQIGALMATNKDPELNSRLVTLKNTLISGMDSIRESVHGLYEESIDLYTEVKTLTDNFTFCEISLDYDIEGNPDKKIKYALLSVIKEALSNITRHSDATSVRVTLREHPALYQLTVKDNGRKKTPPGDGIGLKNIEQRVSGLKGIFNTDRENGFTVFVSIPKEF